MKGSLLAILIMSLTAGILLSHYLTLPAVSALPFIILSTILFLLAGRLARRHAAASASRYNLLSGAALIAGTGIFTTALSRPSLQNFSDGDYRFSGRVIDYTSTGAGDRTLLEIHSLQPVKPNGLKQPVVCDNVKGMITISDVSKISCGDIVSGTATLSSIESKGNIRNDDYVAYQKSKGILLKGYTDRDSQAMIIGKTRGSVMPLFSRIRDNIEITIEKSHLSRQAKGFLISVGLGDRTYMPEDDRQAFIDGGVAHIFAVSGLHVGLIAGFILMILSLFLIDRHRKWKFLIAIPLIWFYIMLTGAAPATIRAGLMLTIGLSALFLQRKHSPLMALGWTILIMLVITPQSLFDIGFQLSAVCVGSLILLAQPLNFIDHRAHPRLHFFVSIILVTMIATFASWTLSAFYFHRLSLMFLPANILAVPLLPFYLATSALYVLLCSFELDLYIMGDILSWLYSKFLSSVQFFNNLALPIENVHFGWPVILFWLGGIVGLGVVLGKQKLKKIWIPGSLFATALIIIPFTQDISAANGFIVQKNSDAITVMSYENGKEKLLTFQAGTISSMNLHGKKILVIDRNPLSNINSLPLAAADFIILGSGIGKEIVDIHDALLPCINPGSNVLIHPSVHWRYERAIQEKGLPGHYSLRKEGPLHFFTDQ